jgi:hypothetical protein
MIYVFPGHVSLRLCFDWLVREPDSEKRDDGCRNWFGFCREVNRPPVPDTHLQPNESGAARRNACSHALRDMQLSGYLLRQKKTSKT